MNLLKYLLNNESEDDRMELEYRPHVMIRYCGENTSLDYCMRCEQAGDIKLTPEAIELVEDLFNELVNDPRTYASGWEHWCYYAKECFGYVNWIPRAVAEDAIPRLDEIINNYNNWACFEEGEEINRGHLTDHEKKSVLELISSGKKDDYPLVSVSKETLDRLRSHMKLYGLRDEDCDSADDIINRALNALEKIQESRYQVPVTDVYEKLGFWENSGMRTPPGVFFLTAGMEE